MDWNGAHVAITGGSSGIGEALAEAASRRGASLTLLARGAGRLAEVSDRVGARPGAGPVAGLPCDVSDREAVRATFARAVEDRGPVEVLVPAIIRSPAGKFTTEVGTMPS